MTAPRPEENTNIIKPFHNVIKQYKRDYILLKNPYKYKRTRFSVVINVINPDK